MLPTEIQAVNFCRLIFPLDLAVQVEKRFLKTDESKVCCYSHRAFSPTDCVENQSLASLEDLHYSANFVKSETITFLIQSHGRDNLALNESEWQMQNQTGR